MSARRFFVPAALAVAACLASPSWAEAGQRILKPRLDTYVNAAAPSRSYSRAPVLRVGHDPRRLAYLRFRVRRPDGELASVRLRVRVVRGLDGQLVIRRAGRKARRYVTWNTAPRVGRQLGSTLIQERGWVDIQLPRRVVKHHRFVALAIEATGGKRVKLASRNSGRSPKLVLETTAAETEAGMTYLDNGNVRLGVNLDEGGTIQYFSPSGSDQNLINNYDLGRQVQQSYYSGPQPYGNPAAPWDQVPWNPIGTGDRYGHPSRILEVANDGTTIYVKSQPLQWALDNVACECVFEQWVQLDANAVWVRNRLTNQRSDTTQYPAFTQELPAVYGTAQLDRFVSYTGSRPFTGGPVTDFGKAADGVAITSTEHWAAMVDDGGWGLGVVEPDLMQFYAHSVGTKETADPNAYPASYLAPNTREILDHDITFDYEYGLVIGTVHEIRTFASTRAEASPGPEYVFDGSRRHWWYANTRDAGWPLQGALSVKLGQSDPQMIGPRTLWSSAAAPKIYISAAYHGAANPTARLFWKVAGDDGWKPPVRFSLATDGQFHTYELDLSGVAQYTGDITQLRFDPSDGNDPGASVDVAYISATPLG